ncbi:hypothetical protein ACFZCK_00215 [Kitasatospora purpeofusca]|uniref:hypothetical protein n=1 Tax=Kitasatospora purpeofusca TaxID=67352 RepID=UPI0036EFC618
MPLRARGSSAPRSPLAGSPPEPSSAARATPAAVLPTPPEPPAGGGRTRISASHRQELKDRVQAAWRQHSYWQDPSAWPPNGPDQGPDILSAETSEDIGVWVALSPETDGTLTLTMSVSDTHVAYAPEHARPLSPLRPDTEDTYWSH